MRAGVFSWAEAGVWGPWNACGFLQENANLDMQTMDTLSEEMETFVRQKGELVTKLINARKEKSKLEQEHQMHAQQLKVSSPLCRTGQRRAEGFACDVAAPRHTSLVVDATCWMPCRDRGGGLGALVDLRDRFVLILTSDVLRISMQQVQVENDEKLREAMRKKLEKELDEEYSEKIEFLKVRTP